MRLIKTGTPSVPPLQPSRPNTLRLVVRDGQILPGSARIVLYDVNAEPAASVEEPASAYAPEPVETL